MKKLQETLNINLAYLLNPIMRVNAWEQIRALPVPAWVGSSNEENIRRSFAIMCAESVLRIYEDAYPDDNRPRTAIKIAKQCLNVRLSNAPSNKKISKAAAFAAADAALAADAAYAAYAALAAYAAAAMAAYATYTAAMAANYEIDFATLADQAVTIITNIS